MNKVILVLFGFFFGMQTVYAGYKDSLIERNKRYLKKVDKKLIQNLAKNGQHPEALILSCSDSRVIPEEIFDAKPGEFFIIRVAGGVIDDIIIDSIEYAIEHLDVNRIIILGHTKCGAVGATILDSNQSFMTRRIRSSVEKARKRCIHQDLPTCSVVENIYEAYRDILKESKIIKLKHTEVYYMLYDIDTGEVRFVD